MALPALLSLTLYAPYPARGHPAQPHAATSIETRQGTPDAGG